MQADIGWIIALLGWPAVIVAAGLFVLARKLRSRMAAMAGCILAAPIFLYLSLTPAYWWLAPPAFALLCLIAWHIDRARMTALLAAALPAVGLLAWLAIRVLLAEP